MSSLTAAHRVSVRSRHYYLHHALLRANSNSRNRSLSSRQHEWPVMYAAGDGGNQTSRRWISYNTANEERYDEKRDASIEPVKATMGAAEESDPTNPLTEEVSKMSLDVENETDLLVMEQLRNSLHSTVQRILLEQPRVRKNYNHVLRRRALQERQQASSRRITQTRGHIQSGAATVSNRTTHDEEVKQISHVQKRMGAHDIAVDKGTAVALQDDDSSESAAAFDEESTIIDTPSGNLSEPRWSSMKQPILQETNNLGLTIFKVERSSEKSLFLELLRQPIEEESTVVNDEGAHVKSDMTATTKSSLLTLLKSDSETTEIENGATADTPPESLILQCQKAQISSCYQSPLLDLLNEAIENDVSSPISKDRFVDEKVRDDQVPSVMELLRADNLGKVNDPGSERCSSMGGDSNPRLPSSIVDLGLALLLALKDKDWMIIEDQGSTGEDGEEQVGSAEEDVGSSSTDEIIEIELDDDFDPIDENVGSSTLLLDDINDLLRRAGDGDLFLSTDDYNVMLLTLATSSMATTKVVEMMLETFRHMSELAKSGVQCPPNASTYTILMVTMERRAQAPRSAAGICREMIISDVKLSSEAIVHGMRCLKAVNNFQDAKLLLDSAVNNESHASFIPAVGWCSLLQMYKQENMQQAAVSLIKKCIKTNGALHAEVVNKVIEEAIYWPSKDRCHRRINVSPLYSDIVGLLSPDQIGREYSTNRSEFSDDSPTGWHVANDADGRELYRAGYRVWRRLIVSAARTDSGWPLLRRAFHAMRSSIGDYWPDQYLVDIGLKTAHATRDTKLACDIVIRTQEKEFESHRFDRDNDGATGREKEADFGDVEESELVDLTGIDDLFVSNGMNVDETTFDSPSSKAQVTENLEELDKAPPRNPRAVRVTPVMFRAAMRLCVTADDMSSAEKLLDCLRDSRNTIPSSIKSQIFALAIKGYAKGGDSYSAERLLREMQQNGPKPTEDAYGSVIYSLAASKRTEEAGDLFSSMESEVFGDSITPGLSSYDARMLALIEAKAWKDVIAFRLKMREAGISMSALSFQGFLLASFRLGDRATALEAVEEAVGSGIKMDHDCCVLSMNLLLGKASKTGDISQVRRELRKLGEYDSSLRAVSLNLSKALRAAEVEENRQPSHALKFDEISSRREGAWKKALQNLAVFARSMDNKDSKSVSSN